MCLTVMFIVSPMVSRYMLMLKLGVGLKIYIQIQVCHMHTYQQNYDFLEYDDKINNMRVNIACVYGIVQWFMVKCIIHVN